MPFLSHETLYTDLDPAGLTAGRVLTEGDPDARFVLCVEGSPIPEDVVRRFGLGDHEVVAAFDEDEARAELAALNRQTYADNARAVGGIHKGLDGDGPENSHEE